MNILAVDTAGKTLGVADAGRASAVRVQPGCRPCPQRNTDALRGPLPRLCGMKCADIDLYAVNAGPGSFTGLRIGLAAVKGMAFAHNTPCAPVSTLEALACAHSGEGTVVCALDARRAQVYSAAFDLATHQRLMEDGARAVKDLASFVQNCKKPVFFVGDGAALCYNEYSQIPGVLAVPPALRTPRGAAVAMVGRRMAQEGLAVPPEALLPDYHRLSQAERELRRAASRPKPHRMDEKGRFLLWQNPLQWLPTTAALN